jgi:uridine phosphorylase
VPKRLRPTAPIAPDAILVGDPGRALLLAQDLLEKPKMSNHARGLWGYSGQAKAGGELTIQATGMGGPSAALVLADLAELGMRRGVRVGTCVGLDPIYGLGALLGVAEARAEAGGTVLPDRELSVRLRTEMAGAGSWAAIASRDTMHANLPTAIAGEGIAAADMQTATVLALSQSLEVAVATILIVAETASGERIDDEALEVAAKRAGQAASRALSP